MDFEGPEHIGVPEFDQEILVGWVDSEVKTFVPVWVGDFRNRFGKVTFLGVLADF